VSTTILRRPSSSVTRRQQTHALDTEHCSTGTRGHKTSATQNASKPSVQDTRTAAPIRNMQISMRFGAAGRLPSGVRSAPAGMPVPGFDRRSPVTVPYIAQFVRQRNGRKGLVGSDKSS